MKAFNTLLSKSKAVAATGAALLLAAPATFAAQVNPNLQGNLDKVATEGFGEGITSGGADALPVTIGRLINAALGLLGIVMVMLVIYAGYLYLTAQGDDDKVATAKTTIKNAVIGAILIFLAYAITNFVIDAIITSAGA
jgi:uncharacterized membrane protein YwzB